MNDYVGLLVLTIPLVVLLISAAVMLQRYNPDGDKCAHGVRGGDGFACRLCTTYPEE
jgi:hypothetical protein